MPLVDYESSDEGSEDGHDETRNENEIQHQETKLIYENINIKDNSTKNNSPLFSALPKPRTDLSVLEYDNTLNKLFLNKKNKFVFGEKFDKKSVKISVPSLSDFDDNGSSEKDQPTAKKLKPSIKGVELFSILPPPKNSLTKESNITLVPNIVSKLQNKQNVNAEMNVHNISKSSPIVKEVEAKDNEDEDISFGTSFFGSGLSEPSISAESVNVATHKKTLLDVTQNEIKENERSSFSWNQPTCEPRPHSSIQDSVEDNFSPSDNILQMPETISVESNPLELDEKALQILCGGKKKRQQMPMNIIDLSGEEIMPDSKQWLLKQFMEEKKVKSHSHRKNNGPSTQQRRKHQITYLAFQAKEQELELQNQWANNRMSRKQTQSKYGF